MKILWLADLAHDNPSQLIYGYSCKLAGSLGEALFDLQQERDKFDACIVRLPLTEDNPTAVLDGLRRLAPTMPIVFIHDGGPVDEAVQLVKLGAYHYFDHVPERALLADLLGGLPQQEVKATASGNWRQMIVGTSPAMQRVVELVSLIAERRSTVLILGETGSGKEVVARAIHTASPRAGRPLVAVNCAAIPENLLEAELFGHVKGAFTGATTSRIGRFEQADQGTLFLDEIGDMPLDLQSKLLRVLQEREFHRVGSSETIRVDTRLIAATNVDLMERVNQGRFREDLYYRLNVVPIRIPALRERPADVADLVHYFVKKVCDQERLPLKTVSSEAIQRLSQYSWPGNVRQLENVVEMAIVLSGDRTTLVPSDIALPSQGAKRAVNLEDDHIVELPETGMDFERVIGRIELNLLEQALQRARGNKKLAADMLGLKRTTLAAKLKSLETLV